MTTKGQSVKQVLMHCKQIMHNADIPNYEQEIKWILEACLQTKEYNYVDCITKIQQDKIINAVQKRAKKIPLAYVLGHTNFFGHDFIVTKDTLIPRIESETLVEQTILFCKKTINKHKEITIIDICSGTGCLALSIAKELKCDNFNVHKIVMIDISSKAIKISKRNAKKLNLWEESCFIIGDCTIERNQKKIEETIKLNISTETIIISNPPYIKTETIKTLSEEVLKEPIIALDGGTDGMLFYKSLIKLISKLKTKYNNISLLALEIGYAQKDSITSLLKDNIITKHITTYQDMSGLDRVVMVKTNQGDNTIESVHARIS